MQKNLISIKQIYKYGSKDTGKENVCIIAKRHKLYPYYSDVVKMYAANCRNEVEAVSQYFA